MARNSANNNFGRGAARRIANQTVAIPVSTDVVMCLPMALLSREPVERLVAEALHFAWLAASGFASPDPGKCKAQTIGTEQGIRAVVLWAGEMLSVWFRDAEGRSLIGATKAELDAMQDIHLRAMSPRAFFKTAGDAINLLPNNRELAAKLRAIGAELFGTSQPAWWNELMGDEPSKS